MMPPWSPIIDTLQLVYLTTLSQKYAIHPSEVAEILDAILNEIQAGAGADHPLSLAPLQGEWLLSGERHGTLPAALRVKLERLRAQGVRNEDVRSWYNLCDLDRRLLLTVHESLSGRMAESLRQSGLSAAEADQVVRKRLPSFATELEASAASDDRELPVEVLLRATDFLDDWMVSDPAGLDRALEAASSCNALIRRLVLGGGQKPCVLIVDDDPAVRKALRQTLEELGYAAAEARDGREALAQARVLQPKAVLMDLSMPEMDGYAAASQLKSDPALASIPIAAYSSSHSPAIERAVQVAGMSTFLLKPVDSDRLKQTLSSLIQAV